MTNLLEKNKSWINIAKICSMVGVVLQHVRGYVYSNDYIFYSVWWSVALFIMIGGYNVYASYENRGRVLLKKKLWGIFIPYFFATLLYVIYIHHYLDAVAFLQNLIHFDATGPLYYAAVYIQLLLISPVLIGVIKECDRTKWFFAIAWVVVIGIGALTTHYTNLFDIAIGGGNLFAGPWILFWFLGMCIKYCEGSMAVKTEWVKWIVLFLTIAVAVWQYAFVNQGINLKLGSMFHGVQVGMTWANAVETVLIFFWFKYAVELLERNAGKIGQTVIWLLSYMGGYTLYIFLYHMLFLSIYREYLEVSVPIINRWICLAFIIIGPVLFGLLLKKGRKYLCYIIKEVEVE